MLMLKKKTDDLLSDLKADCNLDRYLKENEPHLVRDGIGAYLDRICAERGLKKSHVLKRAEINEIYGYQLFSGSRLPSRDKLIALCIGIGLNAEETDQALKYAGEAPLYARSRRDSILISGILNGRSVMEINGLLYDHGEKLL